MTAAAAAAAAAASAAVLLCGSSHTFYVSRHKSHGSRHILRGQQSHDTSWPLTRTYKRTYELRTYKPCSYWAEGYTMGPSKFPCSGCLQQSTWSMDVTLSGLGRGNKLSCRQHHRHLYCCCCHRLLLCRLVLLSLVHFQPVSGWTSMLIDSNTPPWGW